MVERLKSENLVALGGGENAISKFIESDFKIRSGMCPNGCGLLHPCDYGQECGNCGFSCNTLPEKELSH